MWEAQLTCKRKRNDSKNCYDFLSHMWLECKCFCSGKGSWGGGSSYRGTAVSPGVVLFPTGRTRGLPEAAILGDCCHERGSTVSKVSTSPLLRVFPIWRASVLSQCLLHWWHGFLKLQVKFFCLFEDSKTGNIDYSYCFTVFILTISELWNNYFIGSWSPLKMLFY